MHAWAILVLMLVAGFYQPSESATEFAFSRGSTSTRRPTRHNHCLIKSSHAMRLLACRQSGMLFQRHFLLNSWVDRTFGTQVIHLIIVVCYWDTVRWFSDWVALGQSASTVSSTLICAHVCGLCIGWLCVHAFRNFSSDITDTSFNQTMVDH